MRWSENETCLFVRLYLSHRCLWDTEHEDNKSKYHREQAYKDLMSKFQDLTNMELDTNYVKMKIRAIRSTYSQELAKIRDRSTSERQFKPSLKWFNIMHKSLSSKGRKPKEEFLPDYQQDTGDDSSQKVWITGESDIMLDGTDDGDKDPFITQAEEDYILLLKSEPKEESLEPKETKFQQKKRKFKDRSTSSDISESGSYESQKEDEFDIYGKYIASQLRGMDLQRALRVQLQIQRLVSDARIEHLSNGD